MFAKPVNHRLLADLVEDGLAESTYDAQLAGLTFSVNSREEGFTVSVAGYSDKLPLLLRTVISKIKFLVVDPQRLAIMKEQVYHSKFVSVWPRLNIIFRSSNWST